VSGRPPGVPGPFISCPAFWTRLSEKAGPAHLLLPCTSETHCGRHLRSQTDAQLSCMPESARAASSCRRLPQGAGLSAGCGGDHPSPLASLPRPLQDFVPRDRRVLIHRCRRAGAWASRPSLDLPNWSEVRLRAASATDGRNGAVSIQRHVGHEVTALAQEESPREADAHARCSSGAQAASARSDCRYATVFADVACPSTRCFSRRMSAVRCLFSHRTSTGRRSTSPPESSGS
jgi:hypothetical protein